MTNSQGKYEHCNNKFRIRAQMYFCVVAYELVKTRTRPTEIAEGYSNNVRENCYDF